MSVSGKKIAIVIVVGLIAMAAVIIPNMLDREQLTVADEDIAKVVEEQYKIVRKEVDTLVAQKEYAAAAKELRKFIKKFSYRNHWKETVIKEIKELEAK